MTTETFLNLQLIIWLIVGVAMVILAADFIRLRKALTKGHSRLMVETLQTQLDVRLIRDAMNIEVNLDHTALAEELEREDESGDGDKILR